MPVQKSLETYWKHHVYNWFLNPPPKNKKKKTQKKTKNTSRLTILDKFMSLFDYPKKMVFYNETLIKKMF